MLFLLVTHSTPLWLQLVLSRLIYICTLDLSSLYCHICCPVTCLRIPIHCICNLNSWQGFLKRKTFFIFISSREILVKWCSFCVPISLHSVFLELYPGLLYGLPTCGILLGTLIQFSLTSSSDLVDLISNNWSIT